MPRGLYWTEPIELQVVTHFRIIQAHPKAGVNPQDLDMALSALDTDILPSISRLCIELKSIKVWASLHVRYESANPMAEHFKLIDGHLRVPHVMFSQIPSQPHILYTNQLEQLSKALKEANARFVKEQSGLILAEIYSLNMNIIKFNPLSGSGWKQFTKVSSKQAGYSKCSQRGQQVLRLCNRLSAPSG